MRSVLIALFCLVILLVSSHQAVANEATLPSISIMASEFSRTNPHKVVSEFSKLSPEQWATLDIPTLVQVSYASAALANLPLTVNLFNEVKIRLADHESSLWWGKANFNLGFALFKSGKYHGALDAYMQALSIFQSLDAQIQVARVKGTIALLQSEVGDPGSALTLFNEVIAVYEEQQDWHKLATAHHNKAVALLKMAQFDEAKTALNQSMKLAEQYNRPHVLAYALKNQGKAASGQHDMAGAKSYFQQALELATQQNHPHLVTQILVELVDIGIQEQTYAIAAPYLERAFDIATEHGFSTLLAQIYAQRATLAVTREDYRQAWHNLNQSNKLRDETVNSPLVNQLQSLNTYFVTLRNEHEKTTLENQNTIMALQVANAKKEKQFFAVLFILGLVIVVVIGLFLRLAVNKAKRFEVQSRIDPLTQLPNRTAFHEIANDKLKCGATPCCFALADIDDFKQINDNYGHDCGDEILKWVAQQLKTLSKKRYTVARWGGEKFVFVIPSTDIYEAQDLLDKAREVLASGSMEYYGKTLSVSLTFGVTEIQESQTIPSALTVADRFMYEGKSSGKNCVVAGKE